MLLEQIVDKGSDAAKKLTNLETTSSCIKVYNDDEWSVFCEQNGFIKESNGVYVPSGLCAYVRKTSPTLVSDVYHELFGHGLFYEYSTIGHKLKKTIVNSGCQKDFLEREKNSKDEGFFNNFYWDYEGFATWFEAKLCEETNQEKIWEKKKKITHPLYIEAKEQLDNVEEQITRFGLLAQFGFPKIYDNKQILEVTKKIYRSAFKKVDLVLLRGSKKPYSDIDLFIVSQDDTQNHDLGWLDIYQVNNQEFAILKELFDISVTDPLIQGTLVYGNKFHYKRTIQQIRSQPITRQAIEHNLRRSQEQQNIMKTIPPHSIDWYTAQGYANSYQANAEQLSQGHKAFTLQKLESIYGRLRKKKS